jgi:hypothetical protein
MISLTEATDIDAIEPAKAMMPEGLLNSLREEEVLDLFSFLLSRGDRNHKMFRSITASR